MNVNWDMPASEMTAEEYLLVAVVQGLCAALNYGKGVLIDEQEIADDAVCIVKAVKERSFV